MAKSAPKKSPGGGRVKATGGKSVIAKSPTRNTPSKADLKEVKQVKAKPAKIAAGGGKSVAAPAAVAKGGGTKDKAAAGRGETKAEGKAVGPASPNGPKQVEIQRQPTPAISAVRETDARARAKPSGAPAAGRPQEQNVRRPDRAEPADQPTPPVPVPEPVPMADVRDGKSRKNQAGLTQKEIDYFRDLLLDKRRELVGDMSSMEREALRTSGGSNLSSLPLHMADMGTDNYEQEFTLGLVEKDRNLLREINHALSKIQNGTYGICEGTGQVISKARLEAQPWARFSIEHARSLEKRMGRAG